MSKNRRIDGISFARTDENEGLTVTRLRGNDVRRFAPRIMAVMKTSYARVLTVPASEKQQPLLTPEAVDRHFSPMAKENINRQVDRMKNSMSGGSAYWVARSGIYPAGEALTGFIKTSPSKPGKLRQFVEPPNCFVNDLMATTENLAVSSALLYVATTDFRGDRKVVLNAQEGNETENDWLKQIGFEDRGRLDETMPVTNEQLGQYRYEALAVNGVRAALLAKRPWLGEGMDHPAQTP